MSEPPSMKARALSKKIRLFLSDWEEKYFIIKIDNKAHCLLRPVLISNIKSFNVERNYDIRPAKYDCCKGESRKRKLEFLKLAHNKQANMLKCVNEVEEIILTSHKVSHLLARSMKPYSDDEIMKQAIAMLADECCFTGIQLKAKKL